MQGTKIWLLGMKPNAQGMKLVWLVMKIKSKIDC